MLESFLGEWYSSCSLFGYWSLIVKWVSSGETIIIIQRILNINNPYRRSCRCNFKLIFTKHIMLLLMTICRRVYNLTMPIYRFDEIDRELQELQKLVYL